MGKFQVAMAVLLAAQAADFGLDPQPCDDSPTDGWGTGTGLGYRDNGA